MELLLTDRGSEVERARTVPRHSHNGSLLGAWLFSIHKDRQSTAMTLTEFRTTLISTLFLAIDTLSVSRKFASNEVISAAAAQSHQR